MNKEKNLGRHVFIFDKDRNGGESLSLATDAIGNGDPGPDGVFLRQELTLQSYCNSATFNLEGTTLTPELLRKLANELESFLIQKKTENV